MSRSRGRNMSWARVRLGFFLGSLGLACGNADGAGADASDPTTTQGTAGTGVSTGEATMGPTPGTTTASETAPSGSSGATQADSGTGTGTPTDASSGGPPSDPKLCSLEVIDASADPAAVIDAGDGVGQIPTVIGGALLRNCGCHYTDNVDGYVDYDSDAVPMSTLADFYADFAGVFPAGFQGQPTYLACEVRVLFMQPLPMPPVECEIEDEVGSMTMEDLVLFARWFEAGAPDGASFP